MSKEKKRRSILPVFGSQLTSTISIAIVLLILGIVALTGIAARTASRDILENTGFVVIMAEQASDDHIRALKSHWINAPYVADVKYASSDEVMRRWREMMGTDDLPDEDELGGNPFSPEFEVNIKAEYTHPDSVDAIAVDILRRPGVADVKLYGETVAEVNRSIRSIMLVLLCISGALLLISFVLINNTVRLSIYSKRFLIHTMKLVGATAGFIRRPFVTEHIIGGVIAAVIASGLLAAMLTYLRSIEPSVDHMIPWQTTIWVFVSLFIGGALIAGLAAAFGATRYIRISYDDMFN